MTPPAAEVIARVIGDARREQVDHIDVFDTIDSTNAWLMQAPPPAIGKFRIAAARQQTAGRGRRGRRWMSAPDAGLYLSLAWTSGRSPEQLSASTLVIGACVAGALDSIGVQGARLKWPNDIMLNDGKLGGILTESRISASGQVTIVTGIGINRDLGGASFGNAELANVSVSDLASVLSPVPDMAELAGLVSAFVIDGFCHIGEGDTDAYLEEWKMRDWLHGKSVTVEGEAESWRGVAKGIDHTGALLLESQGTVQRMTSGSIRLEPAAERTA